MSRKPNILVCGTPGTGKTTIATKIAETTGMTNVVKQQKLYSEYDENFDTHIIDEDAVIDALEEQMSKGFVVVDYHGCDFFPERWFDLVIVLRCSTEVLYDRLVARSYKKNKIDENMEAEIMQVVLDEAMESYAAEKIVVVENNVVDDVDKIVDNVMQWLQK